MHRIKHTRENSSDGTCCPYRYGKERRWFRMAVNSSLKGVEDTNLSSLRKMTFAFSRETTLVEAMLLIDEITLRNKISTKDIGLMIDRTDNEVMRISVLEGV